MSESASDVIAAAVRRVLTARGPLLEDDLLDALSAEGIEFGPDETLVGFLDDQDGLFTPLADDRWAWIPGLLDGRIFTHRLTAAEIEHDLIECEPDLAPLGMMTGTEPYDRLTDGSPLVDIMVSFDAELLAERGVPTSAIEGESAVLFEPGRLAALGLAAGDLVGLRVTDEGYELGVATDLTPCNLAATLTRLLAENPDEPQELDIAVMTACAGDDSLFRQATAPLGDLLADGGFAYQDDWVAQGGFDFARWRFDRRIRTIKRRYELDDDEAFAVVALMGLYEQTIELGPVPQPRAAEEIDPHVVRATLEFLADPIVAEAVLAELSGGDAEAGTALGLFAELVEPLASRVARPAVRWLRAKAYELGGHIDEAEQTYSAAETLDPSWPLTLLALARYASDRGDAERGLALLRRAGVSHDYHLVQLLERFQPAPREGLGRNQPCWCGSGRKYKVCHLHREQLPLSERAAWLYRKAGVDLFDGPYRALLMDAAEARSEYWEEPDAFERALEDDLVNDVTLFEGGAFEEFVALRGGLLPPDERSLADQWLLVERSVYEVVAVRRGAQMTLRDVRTGDVHDVRERIGSRQVKVGELYCLRVMPAGDTMQIFGGLEPVSLGQRDAVIDLLDGLRDDDEADPVELIAFLSRRFAPPVLQNTEGEPLAMCRATMRVDDPDALATALDTAYDRRAGAGTLSWLEQVITHGMERVRATLTLNGDELQVEANSEARIDRVLATIASLDSSMTVLGETREPAGDVTAVQRLAARYPSPGASLDPADPAVAGALAEYVRKYETAWLDESIPALGGHTPRECANDPTRRDDLIRLLDSLPEDNGQPGTMSPARLRRALGLT